MMMIVIIERLGESGLFLTSGNESLCSSRNLVRPA
jgi:hypothetical protein